jgi:hypothetical protein
LKVKEEEKNRGLPNDVALKRRRSINTGLSLARLERGTR